MLPAKGGTVWLKVVVSATDLTFSVQIHRSSGHPRLDEQAVGAMRHAHFKPHTENGSPIELEVTAPIEYLLEPSVLRLPASANHNQKSICAPTSPWPTAWWPKRRPMPHAQV